MFFNIVFRESFMQTATRNIYITYKDKINKIVKVIMSLNVTTENTRFLNAYLSKYAWSVTRWISLEIDQILSLCSCICHIQGVLSQRCAMANF